MKAHFFLFWGLFVSEDVKALGSSLSSLSGSFCLADVLHFKYNADRSFVMLNNFFLQEIWRVFLIFVLLTSSFSFGLLFVLKRLWNSFWLRFILLLFLFGCIGDWNINLRFVIALSACCTSCFAVTLHWFICKIKCLIKFITLFWNRRTWAKFKRFIIFNKNYLLFIRFVWPVL